MKLHLLDTSAVLAHYLREPGWETLAQFFADEDTLLLLSPVSLVEFNSRLMELKVPEAERKNILQHYRDLMSEIALIDGDTAKIAIQLRESSHPRLPLADSLIAACAKQRNATLIHCDPHFRVISSSDLKQIELPPKTKVS